MNPLTLYGVVGLVAVLLASNFFWWMDHKVLSSRIELKDAEIGKIVVRSNALSEANDQCAKAVAAANKATANIAAVSAARQKAANAAIGEVAKASAAALNSVMALSAQKPSGDLLTDCKTASANIDTQLRRTGVPK